jgi:hypothetical protein
MRTPGTPASKMVSPPIVRLNAAPCTTRLNTSRPRWSVPNQKSAPGGENRFGTFMRTGFWRGK